jgi:hemerythrin-like domain-containing protein
MCQYCGCRAMPLIRDYIAEHDHVLDLGDRALRALDRGDHGAAVPLLAEARRVLDRHWQGEENGLFTVMAAREDEYAAYVAPLVEEHRELAALLARVDVSSEADRRELVAAFADLAEHISKEEDGLFPASLTALDGEDWDASIAAWHAAHPGESLIVD